MLNTQHITATRYIYKTAILLRQIISEATHDVYDVCVYDVKLLH